VYADFAMRDVITSTDRWISRNALPALKKFATAEALLQRVDEVP
jgi:hypothetical protein